MKSRQPYIPNTGVYKTYYLEQAGRGNAFAGPAIQRGYGLGGVLGGLMRAATPLLKQGMKAVGKQALSTGLGLLGDTIQGRNIKVAAKRRLKQAGQHLMTGAIQHFANKPTRRKGIKRKAPPKRTISTKAKRARRAPDIFD